MNIKDIAFDEFGTVILTDDLLKEIVGGASGSSTDIKELESSDNCGLGCGNTCCKPG